MQHPDFRAGGRIFASLTADAKRGTVYLTPEEQERFVREHATVFAPASGAWGRQGWTVVDLAAADDELAGEALTVAWKNVTSASTSKRRRARR